MASATSVTELEITVCDITKISDDPLTQEIDVSFTELLIQEIIEKLVSVIENIEGMLFEVEYCGRIFNIQC